MLLAVLFGAAVGVGVVPVLLLLCSSKAKHKQQETKAEQANGNGHHAERDSDSDDGDGEESIDESQFARRSSIVADKMNGLRTIPEFGEDDVDAMNSTLDLEKGGMEFKTLKTHKEQSEVKVDDDSEDDSRKEAQNKPKDEDDSSSDSDDEDDLRIRKLASLKIRSLEDSTQEASSSEINEHVRTLSMSMGPLPGNKVSKALSQREDPWGMSSTASPAQPGDANPAQPGDASPSPSTAASPAKAADTSAFSTADPWSVSATPSAPVAFAETAIDPWGSGEAVTSTPVNSRMPPPTVVVEDDSSARHEEGSGQMARTGHETAQHFLHGNEEEGQADSDVDEDKHELYEVPLAEKVVPQDDVDFALVKQLKELLRADGVQLWLLPYSDEHGDGQVPFNMVEKYSKTMAEGDKQAVHDAMEYLRIVSFNRKVRKLAAEGIFTVLCKRSVKKLQGSAAESTTETTTEDGPRTPEAANSSQARTDRSSSISARRAFRSSPTPDHSHSNSPSTERRASCSSGTSMKARLAASGNGMAVDHYASTESLDRAADAADAAAAAGGGGQRDMTNVHSAEDWKQKTETADKQDAEQENDENQGEEEADEAEVEGGEEEEEEQDEGDTAADGADYDFDGQGEIPISFDSNAFQQFNDAETFQGEFDFSVKVVETHSRPQSVVSGRSDAESEASSAPQREARSLHSLSEAAIASADAAEKAKAVSFQTRKKGYQTVVDIPDATSADGACANFTPQLFRRDHCQHCFKKQAAHASA
eukprot:m.189566 g.189566  ORF g.189566 m.189566 type:complete len:762 (-) comp21677_c0_seq4:82-2367(-)